MKFVADGMLGKLVRWLRMMGHDVEYSTELDDLELLALSEKEGRILLTRDLELFQRAISKGINAFYVEGASEAERLTELAERYKFSLDIDLEKTRCPRCNSPLHSASKESVVDKVEANTYAHYDEFWQCPGCGQVYWQGAHWGRIRATLREAEKNLERKPES